jgi:hypothetical protein
MKTPLVVLVAAALLGCAGSRDIAMASAPATPRPVTAVPAAQPVSKGSTPAMTFRVLESGSYGPAASRTPGSSKEPRAVIATGPPALQVIWTQYVGTAEPPTIDFDKESVIVLSLGQRSNGGYSIQPVSVQFDGDTATVVARVQRPRSRGITTMAISAPFVAIAVPHQGVTRARWVDENGVEVPQSAVSTAAPK